MIYTIPIDVTYPSVVQETVLDGTTYRFLLRWNAREEAWYLTLRTIDDVEIIASRKLVPGGSLLRQIVSDARPPGELFMLGTPTRDTLGTVNAQLVYIDAESYEAA